jgi:hypothetical protein
METNLDSFKHALDQHTHSFNTIPTHESHKANMPSYHTQETLARSVSTTFPFVKLDPPFWCTPNPYESTGSLPDCAPPHATTSMELTFPKVDPTFCQSPNPYDTTGSIPECSQQHSKAQVPNIPNSEISHRIYPILYKQDMACYLW